MTVRDPLWPWEKLVYIDMKTRRAKVHLNSLAGAVVALFLVWWMLRLYVL